MSAPARVRRTQHAGAREQGSWERVSAALDDAMGPGRTAGSWTQWCCPVHENDGRRHRPSLSAKYLPDAGRTKVVCHAGCDDEKVLDAVGLKIADLYDEPRQRGQRNYSGPGRRRAPRLPAKKVSRADQALKAAGMPLVQAKKTDLGAQTTPWQQVAAYPYMRADGTIAGEVIRKEADFERGRDKEFHQQRWDEAAGRMKGGGFEPIPYQLPLVLDAIESGRVVYVVEGEKDVASAEAAGLVATCNAGGALSWSGEHAKWLKGAGTVVIVADRDTAGYRRADKVRTSLSGLVERVRVVEAATGKDLTDHLQCGHEIGELCPIPYLDPYTRPTPRPAPGAGTTPQVQPSKTRAAEADPVSAASSPQPEGTEDIDMGKYLLAPELDNAPVDTTPDIEHAGAQLAMFWKLLLNQLILIAQKKAEQRLKDLETLAEREEAQRQADEERLAAERKAVEMRLQAMQEQGWHTASREELADAITQARAWAPDSEPAKDAWYSIRTHLFREYGIYVGEADEIETQGTPAELSAEIAAKQQFRAAEERTRKAHDRMVQAVAATEGLDESVREQLYADIRSWSSSPNPKTLDELGKKLAAAKVPERVRDQIRFTAVYLAPHTAERDEDRDRRAPSLTGTHLLRAMDAPLVDPGEETKARIDQMLIAYQDQLRAGMVTDRTRGALGKAVALLTPEDQKIARDRGVEIRKDPTGKFEPLWPDHVDRDELTTTVQMYASLRPQADRAVVTAGDYNAGEAAGLRESAAKYRRKIVSALTEGQGLHDLERDQLACVLRDVDAGQSPPPMLWADDRNAAAHDFERADILARETTRIHRKQLDEILSTGFVDPHAVRAVRGDIERVMEDQVHLASGRMSYRDYGERESQERLATAMAGAGIPEPLRNRAINHIDDAAGNAAIDGKQAQRIRDRWADRTDAIIATRTPAKPAYNSPEHKAEMAADLAAAGLDEDQVAQRMAAARSRANPPSAAVKRAPGENKSRRTAPGSGVHRVHHRNNDRGEPGYGR
ncbi:toprim domain-containing protein [Nocardia carnea]|uniref:toprim domain-containing protein n=1 Tax=Nocardia carnea TaxID=37328 RepID=UPI00245678ED|nr:toprim domain-containing protein [Nocardia carnea]